MNVRGNNRGAFEQKDKNIVVVLKKKVEAWKILYSNAILILYTKDRSRKIYRLILIRYRSTVYANLYCASVANCDLCCRQTFKKSFGIIIEEKDLIKKKTV